MPEALLTFYSERLERHGYHPRGVGWTGTEEIGPCYGAMRRLLGITKADTVLDVGCGMGFGRRYLPGPVFGCDLHGAALDFCGFPTVCGSAAAFRSHSVDFVVAHGAFNVGYRSPEDAMAVVREMRRVARKGFAFSVEPQEHDRFPRMSLWPKSVWTKEAGMAMVEPRFAWVGANLIIWEVL